MELWTGVCPMAANMALCSGTSMRCPLPVRWRAISAIVTDTEPMMAAKLLALGRGRNSGSSIPGTPLVGTRGRAYDVLPAPLVCDAGFPHRSPAGSSRSKPGLSLVELRSLSPSGRQHQGRKFSMRTSAHPMSSRAFLEACRQTSGPVLRIACCGSKWRKPAHCGPGRRQGRSTLMTSAPCSGKQHSQQRDPECIVRIPLLGCRAVLPGYRWTFSVVLMGRSSLLVSWEWWLVRSGVSGYEPSPGL